MNVAEGVWSDPLDDPGAARNAPHDPRGTVSIQAVAVAVAQDRPGTAFSDGEVDRALFAGRAES